MKCYQNVIWVILIYHKQKKWLKNDWNHKKYTAFYPEKLFFSLSVTGLDEGMYSVHMDRLIIRIGYILGYPAAKF